MKIILDIMMNWFWLFLILAVFLGFGIAGYYVDKNTNYLEIEKKKKELREKSMNIEALKNQIKNKNLSLGGTMGVKSGDKIDDGPSNVVTPNTNTATSSGEEDLNVPLNLNVH